MAAQSALPSRHTTQRLPPEEPADRESPVAITVSAFAAASSFAEGAHEWLAQTSRHASMWALTSSLESSPGGNTWLHRGHAGGVCSRPFINWEAAAGEHGEPKLSGAGTHRIVGTGSAPSLATTHRTV
eukprot:CAMPEP_0177590794 /NCGR_PEP_ID=MMETSP0419_2-20121207/7622_1 /TAXON_ID=582737 /ORGANISM="Tetraselmis sp., Strain GSL018" /LENGTH=127 /DNA_ID=CAMNT_0019081429 /DNA_START=413 /DNA_END=796 /DNA_ORIENTATION=+